MNNSQPDLWALCAWLAGSVAGLHTGAGCLADGHCHRNSRRVGLVGPERGRAWDRRPGPAVRLVRGRLLTALCLDHPLVRSGLAISGVFELGPIRDTFLNEKLRLTDEEIVALSPLRLPMSGKPLAIAYGTAELPPLVSDSRDLHARRSAAHLPGALIPVPGGDHFTIVHELRDTGGILTRQLSTFSMK